MTRDIALLLLKDIVDNQFPCFAGEESGLFSLLFKLREDPSRTVRLTLPPLYLYRINVALFC
jgi:hypothetical protein